MYSGRQRQTRYYGPKHLYSEKRPVAAEKIQFQKHARIQSKYNNENVLQEVNMLTSTANKLQIQKLCKVKTYKHIWKEMLLKNAACPTQSHSEVIKKQHLVSDQRQTPTKKSCHVSMTCSRSLLLCDGGVTGKRGGTTTKVKVTEV